MMKKWVLGKWRNALLIRRRRTDRKIKKRYYLFEKPTFHYSTIPLFHG
jgi:hypothetical protein